MERFSAADYLQLSWAPSGPNAQNIGYNWGVCISQGNSYEGRSNCANQNPKSPPGPPGPGWQNQGQTPKGQNSLVLNNVSCSDCQYGQVLTLMLQAVDLVNPSHPTSSWTTFVLDLSSKATVIKNAITDATVPSEPIYPGSTGFTYTLQLGQPAFASGNVAKVRAQVIKGGTGPFFVYTAEVPFTDISPDNTTGVYTASFTTSSASAPWSPSPPGALQYGDVLWVYPLVFNPGNAQGDGTIYYAGGISQTATTITPTAPTGVIWNAS